MTISISPSLVPQSHSLGALWLVTTTLLQVLDSKDLEHKATQVDSEC